MSEELGDLVSFPLRGMQADWAMGLEFLIIFIGLQSFMIFLWKFIWAKEKMREARNFAWGFLPLTIAVVYSCYLQGDFIAETGQQREILVMGGYIALALGSILIIAISEWIDQLQKKYSTKIGVIVVSLVIIGALAQMRGFVIIISFIGAFPLLIFYMVRYTRRLFKVAHASREIVAQILRFVLSLGLIVLAYALTSDLMLQSFGLWIRLIADGLMILGLLLFRFTLFSLPLVTEYDWEQKIQWLLVIHETGIPIYSRFFRAEDTANDEMLVSGALSSVKSLLGATLKADRPHAVHVGDKAFMFEYRPNVIFVIIADQTIRSLQTRLKEFADEFMTHYRHKILAAWDGNAATFGGTEWIADRIFYSGIE